MYKGCLVLVFAAIIFLAVIAMLIACAAWFFGILIAAGFINTIGWIFFIMILLGLTLAFIIKFSSKF